MKNEFLEIKGKSVLRLTGSPFERGYFHGYSLAPLIEKSLFSITNQMKFFFGHSNKHIQDLIDFAGTVGFKEEGEIFGIFSGCKEKINISLNEIKFMNIIGDIISPACSACVFKTKDGIIHGRSLDYPIGRQGIECQTIFVSDECEDKQGWVSVGFPGQAMQYTGMNKDGIVACLHDACELLRPKGTECFVSQELI